MNLFFYMALGRYDFDAGQRHYLGHWKGWVESLACFGPKTGETFNPTLPRACVMSFPCIKIITARAI